MRVERFKHRFVDVVPPYDQMEDEVIYVSLSCNVAVTNVPVAVGKKWQRHLHHIDGS